jgi:hypothetical protein
MAVEGKCPADVAPPSGACQTWWWWWSEDRGRGWRHHRFRQAYLHLQVSFILGIILICLSLYLSQNSFKNEKISIIKEAKFERFLSKKSL